MSTVSESVGGRKKYVKKRTSFLLLTSCLALSKSLRFGWLLVLGLCKEDYLQFFQMCVLFITQIFRLVGKLESRKPV